MPLASARVGRFYVSSTTLVTGLSSSRLLKNSRGDRWLSVRLHGVFESESWSAFAFGLKEGPLGKVLNSMPFFGVNGALAVRDTNSAQHSGYILNCYAITMA